MWDCEAIAVTAGAPSRPGTRGAGLRDPWPCPAVPPACSLPPVSSRAILARRYSDTCLLYRHGCQTAEATEEAGIDDSGPTMLGGGHHQKEADFARVRSEVTEGVPPRSQLAATSSGTEAEVDIRSATCDS